MRKEAKAISEKNIILWALLSGFIATLVMNLAMFILKVKLGVPIIHELIAERFFPSTAEPRYSIYGILIHLALGILGGFSFTYLVSKTKIKRLIVAIVLYSIFLWVIFSALGLPILGFGFFGKYLAGIPLTSEAAFLVYYILFGLTLYPFTAALKK